MLTNSADKWYSLCVRERASWTCERCGKIYVPPTQALHCAHYFSRGQWATRYDPLCALALCYGCHRWCDQHKSVFEELYIARRGKEILEILKENNSNHFLAKQYRRSKGVGEIAAHYKAEYEKMLATRSKGVTGWITFQGWI